MAANVLAHVADPKGVLYGVNHLLAGDGVFVIEVPYLVKMLLATRVLQKAFNTESFLKPYMKSLRFYALLKKGNVNGRRYSLHLY